MDFTFISEFQVIIIIIYLYSTKIPLKHADTIVKLKLLELLTQAIFLSYLDCKYIVNLFAIMSPNAVSVTIMDLHLRRGRSRYSL